MSMYLYIKWDIAQPPKKNEILPCAMTRVGLVGVTQVKDSGRERHRWISPRRGLYGTKRAKQTHRRRELEVAKESGVEGPADRGRGLRGMKFQL